MTRATGQVLRLVGLLIEMLCLMGLLAGPRARTVAVLGVRFNPTIALAVGLAVGFGLWAVGTFTLLRARRRAARDESDGGRGLFS